MMLTNGSEGGYDGAEEEDDEDDNDASWWMRVEMVRD